MVPPDVAEDIVAEAFARVLAAIRAGGGPSHAFRAYLLTAVRHQAHDWQRARDRLTVVADLDVRVEDEAAGSAQVSPWMTSAADTQAEARDEARLITRAFGRLPARWRAVLWQLEVEGKAPAAVAPMFGLSANGVSALAMRAREGLRQAYLEEHVGANLPPACRAYAAEFGAGARGRLTQRRRAALQQHLSRCPACQDLFTELTELNDHLGAILTPVALAAASSALGSAKRSAMRASLAGHWRAVRWHPVTSVSGAAAGVAVAGGMLLAVNITPFASAPAHAAASPVAPAAAAPVRAYTGKHRSGGGGPGGSPAGSGVRSGSASPASSGASAGSGSLAGAGSPAGLGSLAAAPADAPGSAPSRSIPPNNGLSDASIPAKTITGAVGAVGGAVTGVVGSAGGAVTGVVGSAGGAVTGVVGSAGGAVTGATRAASGLVSSAANTVTGVTGGATEAATGTVNAIVAAGGSAVSGAASATTSTVTGAVGSVTSTAATAAGSATAAATGAADAAAGSATGAADAATGTAPGAAGPAAAATTSPAGAVAGAAAGLAGAVGGL